MTTLSLVTLLVICGLILLTMLIAGGIMLLIKLGVIVKEAQRPPHLDSGDYRLDQGHSVVSEEHDRH